MNRFQTVVFGLVAIVCIGLLAATTQAGQNFATNVAQMLNNNQLTYLQTDNQGVMLVAQGASSVESVSASSVIQSGAGRVGRVSVLTVSGVAGTLYDAATLAAATVDAASSINQIAIIPATIGNIVIDMPFTNGLVFAPGAGQTATIGYNK